MTGNEISKSLLGEYLDQWDALKEKHYTAIGKVAARWAYFEAVIDTWAMTMGGISTEIGVCLTSQISGHARKLDAYISLVNYLYPDHQFGDRLNKIANDARGLAEQRNRVVHDHWDVSDAHNPQRLEATARKKLRLEWVDVPTATIDRLVEHIESLTQRFDDLATEMVNVPHPSLEKQPQEPEG